MRSLLPLSLLATAQAALASPRPTTFTQDDRLSTGAMENFVEVWVNPDSLSGILKPDPARDGTGDLVVRNDTMAWMKVTVGSLDLGVVGPLTDGTVHGLKAGSYPVRLRWSNGYEEARTIATPGIEAPAPAAAPVEVPLAPEAATTPVVPLEDKVAPAPAAP